MIIATALRHWLD